MFVKWSIRKKIRSPKLGDSLVARLVESYRPGPGLPPRQRQIAYLGAIRTAMPLNHRVVFWSNAEDTLSKLPIDDQQRAEVRAALARRVPPASWDDWLTG